MRTFLSAIFFVALLATCSANKQTESKADVYAWSIGTLTELATIYPTSFQTMIETAYMPDGLDFTKANLNYDKNSNMQLSLDSVDKKTLRNIGIISSLAEYCDLEWVSNNFSPMMQWQRLHVSVKERNGYQIRVVGFIHGFAQGSADGWLQKNSAKCEQVRRILKGRLFSDKF